MNSSGLLIRPALESDAEAVATIYAPYVRDTAVSFETDAPSADVMAQRIAETILTHPWLVAEREDAVFGYTYAAKHSQRPGYRWTVDATIYLRNEERRNGTGRSLYQALLATLRLQGFRSVFSEIVLPNAGSVGLHETMGFAHLGIHKDIGYKLGRWQDIGYWQLRLSEGTKPPAEPIPFAALQGTTGLAGILLQSVQGGRVLASPAHEDQAGSALQESYRLCENSEVVSRRAIFDPLNG